MKIHLSEKNCKNETIIPYIHESIYAIDDIIDEIYYAIYITSYQQRTSLWQHIMFQQ